MSIFEYNGSAIVAMVGKNCFAIASDRRLGVNLQTVATDFQRIYKIHDKVFVGLSGLGTDAQTLYQRLVFRHKLYQLREERDMKPETFASLVSAILYEKRFGPYFCQPVIAGLGDDDKPFICTMDFIGAKELAKDFVVAGSASESLYGACEALFKPDMEPEELFEVVSQALLASVDRKNLAKMGAEALPRNDEIAAAAVSSHPLILGLQPAALVDHVAPVDWSLLDQIPGDRGGSMPVAIEELDHILEAVKAHKLASPDELSPMKTMAGGSVANTIRGLSAGFGVSCGIIGACGDDEQGKLFVSNMSFSRVNLSRLRMKQGHTAQCICMVDELANRTMRPCLSSAVKIQADELTKEDFKGSKWLVLRYAIFNLDVIQAAIRIAKQEGLLVSLDLASFEMVRNFRSSLQQLLESGDIDLCFANEDEAMELLRGEQTSDPEAAVEFLAKHCKWAVVTLGANGCIARHGKEIVRVPAIGEAKATDATGAGDLFAGGFLYGLIKGLSLEECCKAGACSGGSVIRALGGEVTPENWQWMYKQMQIKGLPLPDNRN